jgi:hypothetical protein
MTTLSEAEVLAIWEAAADRSPPSRALTLAVAGGADPTDVTDVGIGMRDGYLIALREACFGCTYSCVVDCPGCGAELEAELSDADVRVAPAPDGTGAFSVEGIDVEFRLPSTADIIAVTDAPEARRALIARCVTTLGADDEDSVSDTAVLTDPMLDAVSAAMAARDPQAAVEVDLDCAACGHQWAAPFDIAGYLWAEMTAAAARIMRDVHGLASAYGWSEAEVLSVSPARRRQYLELAAL